MTRQPNRPITGMLLVGHGTRNERGAGEFLEAAAGIAALMPDIDVEPAFLEFVEPTIGEAAARLMERGVSDLVVVPLLLFAAGHAKGDIPAAVSAATSGFPDLSLQQADPLECHDKIIEASARRFDEALEQTGSGSKGNVFCIMVGRGSSDEEAIAAMRRFTELRVKRTPVAASTTAFMAIAKPSVTEALQQATASSASTIVVQPHLLFYGELCRRLNDAVEHSRRETPQKKWVVAQHLGPTQLVAEAVSDRFHEALTSE